MHSFMIHALELTVACANVASELLLARKKLYGWVWAIGASLLTGLFFLVQHDDILALFEVLNVPFSMYGFHKWKQHIEKVTTIDKTIAYGAIFVVFVYTFASSQQSFIQMIASLAFLLGSILIARKKKLGWYISMSADILLAYVLLESNDYIFVCFQIISIWISLRKTFLFSKICRKYGFSFR
jgi:hypothetical protein